MSFSNFDDINTICLEFCEEKEENGTKERRVSTLPTSHGKYLSSELSMSFENQSDYSLYF